jgi:hypothetical protein
MTSGGHSPARGRKRRLLVRRGVSVWLGRPVKQLARWIGLLGWTSAVVGKKAAVGRLGGLVRAHAGGPCLSVAATADGPSRPRWLKGPFVFLVFSKWLFYLILYQF